MGAPSKNKLPAEVKKKKSVAKDGSKRGVGNLGKQYKKRRTLQDDIVDLLREKFPDEDIQSFDAIEQAALIAFMAMGERPAKSPDGRPIMDEEGRPLMQPPDLELALRALGLVSRYTHSPMAPRPYIPEDDNPEDDEQTTERKALFMDIGERLGFLKKEDDDDDES